MSSCAAEAKQLLISNQTQNKVEYTKQRTFTEGVGPGDGCSRAARVLERVVPHPKGFVYCSRATAEASRPSPWVAVGQAPLCFVLTLWAKKKQKWLTKK